MIPPISTHPLAPEYVPYLSSKQMMRVRFSSAPPRIDKGIAAISAPVPFLFCTLSCTLSGFGHRKRVAATRFALAATLGLVV